MSAYVLFGYGRVFCVFQLSLSLVRSARLSDCWLLDTVLWGNPDTDINSAIRIIDREKFHEQILSKHFPDSNHVESFLRQLNIYGFLRMTSNGRDHGCYYHEMFLEGRPDICSLMKRPTKSLHTKRRMYDTATEPNFYAMEPICRFLSTHQASHNSNHYIESEGNMEVVCSNNSYRSGRRLSRKEQKNVKDDDGTTANLSMGSSNDDRSVGKFHPSLNQSHFYYSSSTVPVVGSPTLEMLSENTNSHADVWASYSSMALDGPIASFILSRRAASRVNYNSDHTMNQPTGSSYLVATNNVYSSNTVITASATSCSALNASKPQQQQQLLLRQPVSLSQMAINRSNSIFDAYCQNLWTGSATSTSTNTRNPNTCASSYNPSLSTKIQVNAGIGSHSDFLANALATTLTTTTPTKADDILDSCSCGSDITPLPLMKVKRRKKTELSLHRSTITMGQLKDDNRCTTRTTQQQLHTDNDEDNDDDDPTTDDDENDSDTSSSSRTSGSGMAWFLDYVDLEDSSSDEGASDETT